MAASFLLVVIAIATIIQSVRSSLPQMITIKDYKPLLVTQVYDRNGKKAGEFFRERRTVIPYEKMPKQLIQAFLAAEDDQFFEHKGINVTAILRATIANIRAGKSVQGGSTITQQVAKTLMLTSEKTFTRKLKDILLAIEMEKNLKKEDILYLYLNQIYFGQSSYGIELAAQTYFKKSVSELALPEMAILAGLPQAPSRYSPVRNPKRAKERQVYVLRRMADVGYISKEESEKAIQTPVAVYTIDKYEEIAPYYTETIRQILVEKLGEEAVLDQGLIIKASMDVEQQIKAQNDVRNGLKNLDKRQGFRGVIKNLKSEEEIQSMLQTQRKQLIEKATPARTILPNGEFADLFVGQQAKKGNRAAYVELNQNLEGVVREINSDLNIAIIELPDMKGVLPIETMRWARPVNPDVNSDEAQLSKIADALKVGDVVLVKLSKEKFQPVQTKIKSGAKYPDLSQFVEVELDQEPLVEGSLVSFDLHTQDVLAMVGGYDYSRSEFNRAIQAPRQTGSSFKAFIYAAALDRGYTPATPIMDAPKVYHEKIKGGADGIDEEKTWKPTNHSKSFGGDIIMRNALVQSLNIPSVNIIEDLTVPYAADYAQRLGIISPLNMDFTLVLGSSGVTLYEMTKAFSHFARLGKRIHPRLILEVLDSEGKQIMGDISLDIRFEKEIAEVDQKLEERRKTFLADGKTAQSKADNKKIDEAVFFQDPDQLISPQTAYLMTSMLRGVINDPHGTGGRALALGRDVAGKTGSTNNYFDAWFVGYTPQIATGVWVGFDHEKSLGKGEVGGRAALPIWIEYMKTAHSDLPQLSFQLPEGIVFVNIDADTGRLANATSKNTLKQAFLEGTEPSSSGNNVEETNDFYKQDMQE